MGGEKEKKEKEETNSGVLEMDSECAVETACMFSAFLFLFFFF